MTATMSNATATSLDPTTPVPLVSCDGHIGPRLSDMRSYCPATHLEAYDDYAGQIGAMTAALTPSMARPVPVEDMPEEARIAAEQSARMRATEGAHDIHARIRDMDTDGVAVELVFHGVQDMRPVPWVGPAGFTLGELIDPELRDLGAVGMHIYNQWLADACSVAPERFVAAVLLPIWDIDASIAELTWAREAGLKAVNLPAPRRGLRFYDERVWDPFWSACEELGMTLVTHAGALDREDSAVHDGPHGGFIQMIELGGWPGRRALSRLILGGVFERHPELKLLLVEQNHNWWTSTIEEFDSAYLRSNWMVKDTVPRKPSEYLHDHVFIGASFMAPFEARHAIADGYAGNVMWGRDYPHVEGTWQPDDGSGENMTLASLRYCFADIDPAHTRAIVSDNGARILGLDQRELQAIGDRIGSPTLGDIRTPLEKIPEPGRGGALSFRTMGPWG